MNYLVCKQAQHLPSFVTALYRCKVYISYISISAKYTRICWWYITSKWISIIVIELLFTSDALTCLKTDPLLRRGETSHLKKDGYFEVLCHLNMSLFIRHCHYNDVTMSAMASQITRLTIVYSTVYSGANQRKHKISASLDFFVANSPVTG